MAKKFDKVFHKKFGQRVRFLRKEKGLTQEELSFEIDADNSYIANIENAHRIYLTTNYFTLISSKTFSKRLIMQS